MDGGFFPMCTKPWVQFSALNETGDSGAHLQPQHFGGRVRRIKSLKPTSTI